MENVTTEVEALEVKVVTENMENGVTETKENGVTETKGNGVTETKENGVTETKENGVTETKENGVTETKENGVAEPKENVVTEPKENGEAASKESDANENKDAEEVENVPNPIFKTVEGILTKIKEDAGMKDSDKIDTLCILFQRIIEENQLLKTELGMLGEQMKKSNQAKDAVKQLNNAYKKQIELVREENDLKLQEEASKRAECVKSYQTTMGELSTLLETHTGQNSRLREENNGMSDKLLQLCKEGEKREAQITHRLTEYQLQIKLLEHQVTKAQIEKAEIKADMTKERLQIAQELTMERERSSNLEETVRLLKEQSAIYQAQMDDLAAGAGNNSKSFQHFKTQIDKLTKQMVELDKDTHQWREKYEVSSLQVKKMNLQSLEREKEVGQLRKKLESMVALNRTLNQERVKLTQQLQQAGVNTQEKEA